MITADLIPKRMRAMLMQMAPARVRTLLFRLRNSIQSWWPYRISFQDRGLVRKESPFNFAVSRNNILEELGKKYKPTKQLHNYLVYYWLHFRDIRLEVRRVLEIGLETDRSIRMWEEFFPNAMVYGVDINPQCQQFEGDRRRVCIGDQSDVAFLDRVVNEAGGSFDIVIDDGSHRVDHQLKAFNFLFPRLSDHGIYVMEDTGGPVGDFNLITVKALRALVDNIMYWPRGLDPGAWPNLSKFSGATSWIDRNIIGVAFYRWIVFVMRGRNPEDNPFLHE
jgi:hypothetical protein